jgi:hypothetical protein
MTDFQVNYRLGECHVDTDFFTIFNSLKTYFTRKYPQLRIKVFQNNQGNFCCDFWTENEVWISIDEEFVCQNGVCVTATAVFISLLNLFDEPTLEPFVLDRPRWYPELNYSRFVKEVNEYFGLNFHFKKTPIELIFNTIREENS